MTNTFLIQSCQELFLSKSSGGVGDPTEGTLDPMYFLGVKAIPPESLEAPPPNMFKALNY